MLSPPSSVSSSTQVAFNSVSIGRTNQAVGEPSKLARAPCLEEFDQYVQRWIAASGHSETERLPELRETLTNHGYFSEVLHDKEARPLMVTMQMLVELFMSDSLTRARISDVVMVIHADLPPTPLRTECTAGELSEGLVSLAVAQDPALSATVKDRIQSLRECLKEQVEMHAVYSKTCWEEKKTADHEKTYQAVCSQYPTFYNTPLLDVSPFGDLVGATYLFRDVESEQVCAFVIRIPQAYQPSEQAAPASIGLAGLENPEVSAKVNTLRDFLREQPGAAQLLERIDQLYPTT